MDDFFKYLAASPEDKQWGISFNVVGKSTIKPNSTYPSPEHPSGYFFNWEIGRILYEYQVNYITEGKGVIETQNGKYTITAGTILLIKPGMWHRYRPNPSTGWTEHYIGLEGEIIERLFKNPVLNSKSPVINCGLKESLIDCYDKIYELATKEKPGFQLISSGIAIRLLGSVVSHVKNKDFKGQPLETAMEKAKFEMRNNLDKDLDFTDLASSLNLGYSYFRKMFKKHTGVSPGQYHLQLRLMRAKELLLTTDMPIKEVAYETGFESIHYFSRLFKSKIGQPPSELRKGL
ncbi:AraC family transcriptional regulator [Geofilum sp. OHC36d9]|uniref:AraC family transcriptional regulator n=1 Tax=Geofilum sp. OHC36d9 TaxID=3458413 RepID=UPI00403401D2